MARAMRPGVTSHQRRRTANAERAENTSLPLMQHRVAPYGVGMRLDAYLTRYLRDHSRSEWQRMVDSGTVTVNRRATKPAVRLSDGDRIEIRAAPPSALLEPDPSINLDVVFEDEAIVVINKPAGLVVHPAPGHETGTLVHALLARFPQLSDPTGQMRPGIVHRLDKDTSGLMVVGKTTESVAALQGQMQQGLITKRYRLLVLGNIQEDQGIIDAPIGRDRFQRQRMAVRPEGREARTEFTVLERFQTFTYLDAKLTSGRTHQLRVHFAYIRHPVAGDRTYGNGRGPAGLSRQFVHSRELILTSPADARVHQFIVEPAPDLEAALIGLRATERATLPDAGDPGWSDPSTEALATPFPSATLPADTLPAATLPATLQPATLQKEEHA